jgi:hypothetical protein
MTGVSGNDVVMQQSKREEGRKVMWTTKGAAAAGGTSDPTWRAIRVCRRLMLLAATFANLE